VLVTSTERTWQRLPAAIGRPELLDDPRFATNQERVRHNDALMAILIDWFAGRTWAEARAALDAARCPVSPVYSIQDIAEDPHYAAREDIVRVSHPTLGELAMPGIVPKLSRTPGAVTFPGPDLGAHNADVYGELLGLSSEEIALLAERGTI
jgi:formyl-CoA transferase